MILHPQPVPPRPCAVGRSGRARAILSGAQTPSAARGIYRSPGGPLVAKECSRSPSVAMPRAAASAAPSARRKLRSEQGMACGWARGAHRPIDVVVARLTTYNRVSGSSVLSSLGPPCSRSRRRLYRDPAHPSGPVEGMRVRRSSALHALPSAQGMLTSGGSSPSIIEFASREDAQRAINEFSDKPLLGRPVFIREASSLLPFVAARPPSAR
jgi:hypothetical protein